MAGVERRGDFRGMTDNFTDPFPVPLRVLRILLNKADVSWDYWGKFYTPGPDGGKYRELNHVLANIADTWKCPGCECVGCHCCSVDWCHHDNYYHPSTEPCNAERS
jgi:hypothetical protein